MRGLTAYASEPIDMAKKRLAASKVNSERKNNYFDPTLPLTQKNYFFLASREKSREKKTRRRLRTPDKLPTARRAILQESKNINAAFAAVPVDACKLHSSCCRGKVIPQPRSLFTRRGGYPGGPNFAPPSRCSGVGKARYQQLR